MFSIRTHGFSEHGFGTPKKREITSKLLNVYGNWPPLPETLWLQIREADIISWVGQTQRHRGTCVPGIKVFLSDWCRDHLPPLQRSSVPGKLEEISPWDSTRERFPIISPVPCTFHFLLVMLNQDTFDFRLGRCQRDLFPHWKEKRSQVEHGMCQSSQRSTCSQDCHAWTSSPPQLEFLFSQIGSMITSHLPVLVAWWPFLPLPALRWESSAHLRF